MDVPPRSHTEQMLGRPVGQFGPDHGGGVRLRSIERVGIVPFRGGSVLRRWARGEGRRELQRQAAHPAGRGARRGAGGGVPRLDPPRPTRRRVLFRGRPRQDRMRRSPEESTDGPARLPRIVRPSARPCLLPWRISRGEGGGQERPIDSRPSDLSPFRSVPISRRTEGEGGRRRRFSGAVRRPAEDRGGESRGGDGEGFGSGSAFGGGSARVSGQCFGLRGVPFVSRPRRRSVGVNILVAGRDGRVGDEESHVRLRLRRGERGGVRGRRRVGGAVPKVRLGVLRVLLRDGREKDEDVDGRRNILRGGGWRWRRRCSSAVPPGHLR
mmetsp:Transcript_29236/g.86565  ORF Transcript_29236/g.86565 Transcript_29236/m.86565 type:complete len:325 (-) Transcript_29236:563-1537(-)